MKNKELKPKKHYLQLYISSNTKANIYETMNKYHVSMGTIATTLYLKCTKYLTTEQINQFITSFIEQRNLNRTSINTTIEYNIVETNEKLARLISNLLYIQANNLFKNYFDKKRAELIKNEINTALQKTKERYWNYNEQIRITIRAISIAKRKEQQQ